VGSELGGRRSSDGGGRHGNGTEAELGMQEHIPHILPAVQQGVVEEEEEDDDHWDCWSFLFCY